MSERLRIERKRFHLLERRQTKSNTLDSMIQQKEWVEDGMEGLMRMMKDSWTYFDALVCLSCYQPLSCHQYSWALGYSLASLWVMSVNARIGCIERMVMKDYHSIQQNQFHLASDFKTSETYHYQIVMTTDIVGIFIKYIRKHIIPEDIDSEDAVVFPSFKGSPLCQGEASKKVSNIFKRYGYHLSVTKLRAMISTHVEDKFRSQEITLEEYQTFVQSGQTHSTATHKKYYVKKRKYVEGEMIQSIHQKVFPQPNDLAFHDHYDAIDRPVRNSLSSALSSPSPSSSSPSSSLSSPISVPSSSTSSTPVQGSDQPRIFGLARDDVNEVKKKYEWIEEEISYLQHYIQSIEPQLPGTSKNRYAACLTHLKQTAPLNAIQYFHPHHLMNSDRLKNGFLRAAILNNE
jgi:hypothetical protein